jgi:hypothetical protein
MAASPDAIPDRRIVDAWAPLRRATFRALWIATLGVFPG